MDILGRSMPEGKPTIRPKVSEKEQGTPNAITTLKEPPPEIPNFIVFGTNYFKAPDVKQTQPSFAMHFPHSNGY